MYSDCRWQSHQGLRLIRGFVFYKQLLRSLPFGFWCLRGISWFTVCLHWIQRIVYLSWLYHDSRTLPVACLDASKVYIRFFLFRNLLLRVSPTFYITPQGLV